MKQRAVCVTCETKVKPNSTSKLIQDKEDPCITIMDHNYSCPECEGKIDEKSVKWEHFDTNEAMKVLDCLQKGHEHQDVIGGVDLKIGDTKTCRQCGNITDVVIYTGCIGSAKNSSSACRFCDNNAVLKGGEDFIEEYNNSCKMYKKLDKVLDNLFVKFPPQSDSIFELYKIAHKVMPEMSKYDLPEYMLYITHRFLIKCAELDLITIEDVKGIHGEMKNPMVNKFDVSDDVRNILKTIYEKVPIKSDSVLELDRLVWLVQNMSTADCSTRDYELLLTVEFINKCAELDLLRISSNDNDQNQFDKIYNCLKFWQTEKYLNTNNTDYN